MDRFERQVILPGFGPDGQARLRNAAVLVIGAGGLGCPILLYLAAAGVGKIGIVDGDSVAKSNLNRQVLYGEKDLGKNKAETAARHFQEKYKDICGTSLVTDAGYTVFQEPTTTCLGLGPIFEENIGDDIKSLQTFT